MTDKKTPCLHKHPHPQQRTRDFQKTALSQRARNRLNASARTGNTNSIESSPHGTAIKVKSLDMQNNFLFKEK